MTTECYRARWVFPIVGPPLEDGVLELSDGLLTALHNRQEPRAVDLGNVAVLPGLVNTHTHLEFSDLPNPIQPAEPFTAWVRGLVAHRRSRQRDVAEILATGLTEATETGTRVIGEIATAGWSPKPFLNQPGCETVVFRELLGLLPEHIKPQLAIAKQHLSEPRHAEAGKITRGLSPHAPYSVHPDLFRELVSLCREQNAPLAMHLAETQAELQLLSEGTGQFVEMLSAFGVWRDGVIPKGSTIRDYLEPMAQLGRGLVIHGNYLSDDDITFLAKHPQLTVVYCPRTHAFFGHRQHPWPKLLEAGVRVALGTDSLGSNPDLNLWNEVKFLARKHPKVPPDQWLRWATREGAMALFGPKTSHGQLQVGQPARWITVPLVNPDASDPYAALLG